MHSRRNAFLWMCISCSDGAPYPVTGLYWQTLNPTESVAKLELKYRCFSSLFKYSRSEETPGQKELILAELYTTEISFPRTFFLFLWIS